MTISIVIRAFNEAAHIGQLLYGISQQTHKDTEVIIVDSGSTDETINIAEQFHVKIIYINPNDFTFGRSLNRGIAAATGDIVVIISAHCFPIYPDWLLQLNKPFSDPNIGMTYGRQKGGETNFYSEHQFFKKYFPQNSVTQQAHPYSHNANAAIRRKLWEQNPYDEDLTGLEDLAWSSWLMEQGYDIAYIAEAEVIHTHKETFKQVKNRYKREAVAMKQFLPSSQFSFWHFFQMWLTQSLSDMNQARRESVFFKQIGSIILFRFMQYWGTYQGFHFSGNINQHLHQTFYYPPNILDKKSSKPRLIDPIKYANDD